MSLNVGNVSRTISKTGSAIRNAVKPMRQPADSSASYAYIGGFYGQLPKTLVKKGSIVGTVAKKVVNFMKKLLAPLTNVNSNKKAVETYKNIRKSI